MSSSLDYPGLVKLLATLKRMPDALGHTLLSPEEAREIRLLGFRAEAGAWTVPPLPPDLVRDNWLLEPLSTGWNEPAVPAAPATGPAHPRTLPRESQEIAPSRDLVESSPGPEIAKLSPVEERLVWKLVRKMRARAATLTGPVAKRRRWQQLYWRFPARVFNQALQIILNEGSISFEVK